MLLRVGGLLAEIGRIVRACHERWDGEGYPDGIAGEQIPLIARIVALLRRVQRDDERPLVPKGVASSRKRPPSCGGGAGASSILASSMR